MKNCEKIKVLGIGDYGISVIEEISKIHTENIEYLNLNTDWAYFYKHKNSVLKLGPKITRGLGAGACFSVGKKAAEESSKDIRENIKNSELVIIVAGLGGGTGSGASPVVASIAKELNIPVIAFVAIPFEFENKIRCKNSEESLKELIGFIDSLRLISIEKTKDLCNNDIVVRNLYNELNSQMLSSVLKIIELLRTKSIKDILKIYNK